MRKVIISLAAAGTALAFATPVSAQYWPQTQPQQTYGYGYNQGAYGYNQGSYGYNQSGYGQARFLQARVDRVQGQLDRLAQRGMISRGEYASLHGDSHRIERRLRQLSSYGLGPRERFDIEQRIARLEQRIAFAARDGRGWNRGGDYHGSNGQNGYYGQSGYGNDRDRDGRHDNDHGDDHDD